MSEACDAGHKLVNLGHDAGMNARPPELNPAAGKAGEPLDISCLRRPQHADAVVAQIAFIVEGSGIAIIARRMQLGENAQPRAVGEWRDGRLARRVCTIRSIEAGREPALSLPKGRPALHWLCLFVNGQPHPSPHRPAFTLARDLFRLDINGFTNLLRPRGPRISLTHHVRRERNFTTIRQGRKFEASADPAADRESESEKHPEETTYPTRVPWPATLASARNHDAAKTNATTAITHHDGGRQARTPVHRPSENVSAAQNNGCRGGLWLRIIRQVAVWRRNLDDVKAVSAPAASPIRCETSQETDRTSVLPRCGSRPPGGGRDPWPASPDRTKHIGREALRVPPASELPLCRRRCGEGPGRPNQAVSHRPVFLR